MAADGVAIALAGDGADDGSAFVRGGRPPVDRKTRLAAGLWVRGDPNMIGTVRTIHGRIQKAIGPPLRAGPMVNFQCFCGHSHQGRPLCLYIIVWVPRAIMACVVYYLLHFVPSDQSIDLSGRTMPSELKVPPALMVMSLVTVPSASAPFSPLICTLLPD